MIDATRGEFATKGCGKRGPDRFDRLAADLDRKIARRIAQLGRNLAQAKNVKQVAQIQEEHQSLEDLRVTVNQLAGASCASKKALFDNMSRSARNQPGALPPPPAAK